MIERIKVGDEQIVAFCEKWRIAELSFFGSVIRDDFDEQSDVDVLVTFAGGATWDLLDWVDMIDELTSMFGRKVDLVSAKGLRNPFRRKEILSTRRVIYAA